MSLAKITLIGMYDYDETLFDNMQIPETLDKQTLIGNILLRGGEFETLYASVPFMKQAIGIWSGKWQDTFERWAETVVLEYNPIENYDRIEEWDDDHTGTQTSVRSGNETIGKAGTETHTGSGSEDTNRTGSVKDQAGGGTTNLNEVSAFDAGNTLTTHDKQTFGTTQSNETTYNNQKDTHTLNNLQDTLSFSNRVDTTTYNDIQDERTDDLNTHHEGRVHGNIGVTTSQQMMESEMNLRLKWNLYNQITDLFLTEFVIPVY